MTVFHYKHILSTRIQAKFIWKEVQAEWNDKINDICSDKTICKPGNVNSNEITWKELYNIPHFSRASPGIVTFCGTYEENASLKFTQEFLIYC